MTTHNRRKTPTAEAIKPKHKPQSEARSRLPQPGQSATEIKAIWAELKAARRRTAETQKRRHVSAQNRRDWAEAVGQKYQLYKNHQFKPVIEHASPIAEYGLHGSVTEVARYDWDFWRDMELLRGGDNAPLETAVAFLEAAP